MTSSAMPAGAIARPARLASSRADGRRGRVAVEGYPAAHHVVAGGRVRDRAGRVGGVNAIRGRDPGRGQGRAEGLETLELQPGERVCRVVGDGQVRPEAGVVQLRRLDHLLRRSSRASPRSAPTRCMPVSTLTSTSTRREAALAARRIAFTPSSVYTVGTRSRPTTSSMASAPGSERIRIGATDAGLAQRHALFDECHRQRGGTARQRGDGDGSRTVAVGVGLHHRAQPGRRDERREQTGVRRDGVQVHVRPGRAPPSFSHARLDSTVATSSGRSPARSPSA